MHVKGVAYGMTRGIIEKYVLINNICVIIYKVMLRYIMIIFLIILNLYNFTSITSTIARDATHSRR
jgi:hypothetical protein